MHHTDGREGLASLTTAPQPAAAIAHVRRHRRGAHGLRACRLRARRPQDSELDTVDARFAIRGDLDPPEDIVIVGIDEDELRPARRALALPAHPARRSDQAAAGRRRPRDRLRRPVHRALGEPCGRPRAGGGDRAGGQRRPRHHDVNDRGGTNVFGGDDVLRTLQTRAAHAGYATDAGRVVRRMAHDLEKLDTAGGCDRRTVRATADPQGRVPGRPALDRLPRQVQRRDDPVLPRSSRTISRRAPSRTRS